MTIVARTPTETNTASAAAASAAANSLPALPAGLAYTSDAEPGIARLRKGKGFAYRRHDGKMIRDENELKRIRQLAIPPAYKDVWICLSPKGHLQATGMDARGRKQYRYHPDWRFERDAEKFDRMMEVAELLPKIRRRVGRDIRRKDHSRDVLAAAVVKLLDTTLGRIGNDSYARDNGSYGLTTLCNRHVHLEGNRLELSFKGKSGVIHKLEVNDADIARIVKQSMSLKGKTLFRYADASGQVHRINSSAVNEYLCEVSGQHVSAKDFRTWHASVLALEITERALQQQDKAFTLKKMLVEVSESLGNTPAVCKKSYVHPNVLAFAMTTASNLEKAAQIAKLIDKRAAKASRGLRSEERRFVGFTQLRLDSMTLH